MRIGPLLFAAVVAAAGSAAAQEPLSPIRMNQLGFERGAVKRAVVPNPSRTPLTWSVTDRAGRVSAQGVTRVVGDDPASGEHVHQADLSALDRVGEGYRLRVGDAQSRPFRIGERPYARLKYDSVAFFHHNRSGVAIDARLVGDPKWARPAGHLPDRATCFSGTDTQGNRWPGCSYTLDATGGWYDAGDHGKYVVNGGISLWTLLNAHERAQARGKAGAFADGRLAIPERRNRVNDLLDEARWQLRFMLAMQAPEGQRLSVPVGPQVKGKPLRFTSIDASGMAHHKLADEKWTSLPTAPHEDKETRYLYAPSTTATLNLAATAAQCARVWRTVDRAFSATCLRAAERAYVAAWRNPAVYPGDFNGSGGYGDDDPSDEFYWAAAELYATTGKAEYLKALRDSPHFLSAPTGAPGGGDDIAWPEVGALGTITLATVPNRLPAPDRAAARANLIKAADRYLADSRREGYAIPYSAAGYPWGSTSSLLNRAIILGLAHDFTGRRDYRNGMVDAMDYVLGRNPLDQSYITGYGARPMQNPHHRFWARQLDPKYPSPPPGVISGGPNSTNMGDPVAQTMKGKCRPQTCWKDDIGAFTFNEVAINWNAPLFWVAAYLDER